MELNEIKNMWQQLDKTMQQQKLLNENIIRQLTQQRSGRSFNVIERTEYTGLVTGILLLLIFSLLGPKIDKDPGILICYIITLITGVATLLFSWYKLSLLSKIDIVRQTVSEVAERTERFRLLVAREKLILLALAPVMIGTFFVVVVNIIHGKNVFDNPGPYMPRIIAGIISYIILATIFYNRLYFKNIKTITNNLEEIKKFRTSDS